MKLIRILTSEDIERERDELKEIIRKREMAETRENIFYRGMRSIGFGQLIDYLTFRDYDKAKEEATERVIAMIPYTR